MLNERLMKNEHNNVKFASQIIDKSRAFHLVPTYLQEKFVLQNVETLSG